MDLRERIDAAFEQCPDCDGYFVQLGNHDCTVDPIADPRREERRRIAATDDRPADEPVGILPTRTVSGAYAYHELDDDGEPVCGGGGSVDDESWCTVTRGEAKSRGKSPCRTCMWLADDGDVDRSLCNRTDGRND